MRWASRFGVKITVFLDWWSFFVACKCFAPATGEVFEGLVYRRILERSAMLDADPDGLAAMREAAVVKKTP